jgi:hypothetical protein
MIYVFFVFRKSLLFTFLVTLVFCWGCGEDNSVSSDQDSSDAPTEMERLQIQNQPDRPLVQPVTWENDGDLEHGDVASHLIDLYDEVSGEAMSMFEEQSHSNGDDCHECGRETGFLPSPSLSVDGFTQLSEKDADFILLSWGAVPDATTYQMIKIQVSDTFSEVTKAVSTDTLELGLSLDYEYVYLLYLIAYDDVNKIRSAPSDPILIYCNDVCNLLPY